MATPESNRFTKTETAVGKKIAVVIFALGTAWYFASQIRESKRLTPVWKFKSQPPRFQNWDRFVRTVIDPFDKLLADGIMAHFWDFNRIDPQPEHTGILVEADPDSRKRSSFIDEVLVDTRWGWQNARRISLDLEKLAAEKQTAEFWHFAFKLPNEPKITVCRIAIPKDVEIRFLVGDSPVLVYALNPENKELPAKIGEIAHRRDPEYQDVRLF